MGGKPGPTIQKNMTTITVYQTFSETKISLWPVLAHQKSRCQKLRKRRPRTRKFIRLLRSRESLTVTTTTIITRTGERRKPRLPGHIRFGDDVSIELLHVHASLFRLISQLFLNGFPCCLGCILSFLLSSSVALSDFGHVDWCCEGNKVDKTCSL
jgi:hypothetical protein